MWKLNPSTSPSSHASVALAWQVAVAAGDEVVAPDIAQLTILLGVRQGVAAVQAVVTVSGEIDIRTAPTLHAAALGVVERVQPRPDQAVVLVLDLERVTLLDSTALHFLERVRVQGLERGWSVDIRPPRAAGPAAVLALAAARGWLGPMPVKLLALGVAA